MPHLIDHLLTIFFVLAWPLYEMFIRAPRFGRDLASGDHMARERSYKWTIAIQWALAGATFLVWSLSGRSWNALGFGHAAGPGFFLGIAVVVAVVLMLGRRWSRTENDPVYKENLAARFQSGASFLPKTDRESVLYTRLGLTAGFCEEVLYRGWLLWYVGSYVPMIAAVPLTALLFGVAHIGQGFRRGAETTLMGFNLALLYVLSGSLWLPIIIHGMVDASGGLLARYVLSSGNEAPGG